MDILEAAKLLGLKPVVMDRVVARIECPWCGARMWLSLAYNRYCCNSCEESGNAEQLLRFAPLPFQNEEVKRASSTNTQRDRSDGSTMRG